jgi:hypothetical protein
MYMLHISKIQSTKTLALCETKRAARGGVVDYSFLGLVSTQPTLIYENKNI